MYQRGCDDKFSYSYCSVPGDENFTKMAWRFKASKFKVGANDFKSLKKLIFSSS